MGRSEAHSKEAGFLLGTASPSHQLEGLESTVSTPSEVYYACIVAPAGLHITALKHKSSLCYKYL